MGQQVEFEANGATGAGYLAEPEGEEKAPGLVVLQEWWGIDDHIRDVCDRFAGEGFIALAPDLYHGETADQPDEAQQKMMALNMDEAEKEMRGAVNYLLSHERSNGQVGSVGFCLGGGLSVWAATVNDKVGAVSTFYYVMPHGKPDFSKLEGKPHSSSTRAPGTRSSMTPTVWAPTTRAMPGQRGGARWTSSRPTWAGTRRERAG